MLLPFFQWLQSTELGTGIRESELVYPIIMTLHLLSIALFGGMILLTDARLLGWAMKSQPVSDVVGQLRVLKRVGFVVMVTCGSLLMISKAEYYYNNPYYWTKMILLVLVGVHALVFRRSVYGNLAELDRSPQMPRQAKVAACISLALWMGLVCAGRWIAYYEAPKVQQASISRG